jgi:hypothetical protein
VSKPLPRDGKTLRHDGEVLHHNGEIKPLVEHVKNLWNEKNIKLKIELMKWDKKCVKLEV